MSFFGFLAGECEIHLTAYLFTNDGYQDVSLPPLLCLLPADDAVLTTSLIKTHLLPTRK
jgi:hypothetical protein